MKRVHYGSGKTSTFFVVVIIVVFFFFFCIRKDKMHGEIVINEYSGSSFIIARRLKLSFHRSVLESPLVFDSYLKYHELKFCGTTC